MQHTVAVRRPTTRSVPALALLPALLPILLTACSDDGRTMALPRPGQTTTSTLAPLIDAADGTSTVFAISTPATEDGGELPSRYTCSGEGMSPPLAWVNVPVGAVQLAVVIRDRDADGFVHWLVTGIDPTTQRFGEGGLPEVAVEQVNTTGAVGWYPPCPPEGGERHIYDIVLHVLRAPIDIDPALPAAEAAAMVEAASVEEAPLAVTVTPSATGAGSVEE